MRPPRRDAPPVAARPGVAVRERTIELDGGPVRLLEAAPGTVTRPTLLLVHGAAACADFWRPNLGPLAAAGRRIVAPDLPAHGGTPSPPRAADLSVRGVARVLAALLARLGEGAVDVVGHSLGGLFAARLALDHPERVRRLVLVAPAGLTRRVPLGTAAAIGRYAAWWLLFGPGPGEAPPAILSRFCHDPAAIDRSVLEPAGRAWRDPERRWALARMVLSLLGRDAALGRDLARLAAPTLLVWGEEDRIVPVGVGRRAAARLARGRLAVLGRCGHLPSLERLEAFNGLVTGFLDAADTGGAAAAHG